MIDSRLLEHWRRQRHAREQLRRSLPATWRDDPRPRMDEVRETWVEAMFEMQRAPMRSGAIGLDDR
jgi:hypothetical protein